MESRLKELICYFISHAPHCLNKTEIIKMIFMFEFYHMQTYGVGFTDIDFIRWDYGPYCSEIDCELGELVNFGIIDRETVYRYDRNPVYLHSINHNYRLEPYILNGNVAYVADYVLSELSNKSYDNMINIVYSTPPMLTIAEKEALNGSKLYGEVLNMKDSKPIYKTTRARLIAVRQERLERENRGTDEEYLQCVLEEYKELEPLRRRANQCHQ